MTDTNICPCNSGASYAACCEPLLAGDRPAETALALMRSRYTAYVVRNVDYLLKTWHPSTRPAAIDPAAIPEWYGLHIVRTEKGMATDGDGVVEFKATALAREKMWRLHEVSRFMKKDGQWLYVDGDTKGETPPAARRAPKVGRNEPCPCGSDRKFKKCCGP
ncbi:MAG: SEC-C domain-containing protein [Deltaproteobacteria bacterium]|nr:SEC-C domain-containing protein [Deltaproteobacteria bacterium]